MNIQKMLMLAAILVGVGLIAPACAQTQPNLNSPSAPGDYYVFQKVVYQNSGGLPDDRTYFLRLLRNVSAHIRATGGNVEIRVVSFATGVRAFQMAMTDPELAQAIDAATASHVRLLICRNTLTAMNLTPADLYGVTEADVVPSGVAEIARLQGQGFVYVHP